MANVTVVSSSPQIIYEPASSWTQILDDSGFDTGGLHMVTEDPNAYATITYDFSWFYFYAARWPYHVACQITTGSTTSVVDLQDHTVPDLGVGSSASPTVKSKIAFKGGTGEFGTQTIRISIPPGEEFAVVDTIIFDTTNFDTTKGTASGVTFVGGATAPAVSFTTADPTAPLQTSTQSQPSLQSILPWVVLAIGVVLALIAFAVAICLCRRRHRRQATITRHSGPIMSATTNAPLINQTINFVPPETRSSTVNFSGQPLASHRGPRASTLRSSGTTASNMNLPFATA